MAQYTTLLAATPITLSDGASTFRLDVRSSVLYFDQTITSTGFSGVEGTDWDTIDSAQLAADPGEYFRVGVRSCCWRIDQTYEPLVLGFDGAEGFDWDNVETHCSGDIPLTADSSIGVDTSIKIDTSKI